MNIYFLKKYIKLEFVDNCDDVINFKECWFELDWWFQFEGWFQLCCSGCVFQMVCLK